MSSVKGLDQRLQDILLRPEFLEMRGVAKEVPIFIQTYSPADEDELRRVRDSSSEASPSVLWLTSQQSVEPLTPCGVSFKSSGALHAPE